MHDPFALFQTVSLLAPAVFSGAVRNTTMIRLTCLFPPLFSFFLSFLSFRYSSFSNTGGRKTAQRILLACVVSLCSLLGAISFDLSSSLEAWRSTGKALQELASCETLWAIRLISLLLFTPFSESDICTSHCHICQIREAFTSSLGILLSVQIWG